MEKSGTPISPEIEKLSKVFDKLFTIPGTNIAVGLDGIIGLVPGLGDSLTSLFSSYIVYKAAIIGMPKIILARMIWNVVLDTLVGAVPVVGDIFDVLYKSNVNNINLMREVPASRLTPRTNKDLVRIVKIAAFVIFATLMTGFFFIARLLWEVVQSI